MKWLLLIITLPTQNATARMRAWRTLKASGAAVLRDGVYLLPNTVAHSDLFNKIELDISAAEGTAYCLQVVDDYPFAELFNRNDDYRQLVQVLQQLDNNLDIAELNRQARKYRQTFNTLVAIDFFPGEAQRQTLALLDALDQRINIQISPDEPGSHPGVIPLLDAAQFQGKRWATRKHPWVDRLASAWLIRRFIDPNAHFVWLESPAQCPADALGYDFDGARFSHVDTATGTLVTFETLAHSFGLHSDLSIKQLAHIIHVIDVGGLAAPEAAGLERLVQGMCNRISNDDTLLTAAEQVFNDLYLAFQTGDPHE
jgi:hypothetical protein